jgi:hypothetical protein
MIDRWLSRALGERLRRAPFGDSVLDSNIRAECQMSKPPWTEAEFPECSTGEFLSAIHIARRGVIVSRRWEQARNVAKESDYEPLYQMLKQHFFGVEIEKEPNDDSAPEMQHSPTAIQFCERLGRETIQRNLLAAMIGRLLLEEFRARFVAQNSLVAFYDDCSNLSFAVETHLHYLARIGDEPSRKEALERVDRQIDIPTLALRVEVVREVLASAAPDGTHARSLCERILALSVAARYLQYIETATHRSPASGMREPLDRPTLDRLGVVIRSGGNDVVVSLIVAVNIAQNLEYEDLRSKSPKTEAVIDDAAGYLRNADDLIHKRYITGMRQVIQSLLQKRRRTGESIVAERIAQLYRITNPDFISWNLSRADLQKFYRIITACSDVHSEEPVTV